MRGNSDRGLARGRQQAWLLHAGHPKPIQIVMHPASFIFLGGWEIGLNFLDYSSYQFPIMSESCNSQVIPQK